MNDATDALDRRLDAELRTAFSPPAAAAFAGMAASVAGRPLVTRRPFWPWLAAAAALMVAAILWATRPGVRGPEGHDGHQLGAMWAAAYHDAVAQGFCGNMGCCNTGVDLQRVCKDRFHCPLAIARDSDVAVLGTYSGKPTGGSMTLLASAGGVPMCVCVVPQGKDPRVRLPDESGLSLARREVGDLVLYAVAKEPVGKALDAFVVP